ncbi:Nucleosomal histone H3-Lys79 methylase [Entomortierella chlamydospora]|uniref:Histone-lysine N-methyltransferase, H3 lysine-79 specific n=1 Tax=Entomortierella chlamydospora TaxID=101097 RepID=A0A9P6SUM8_9FUNG|nr:Nucleosomal histone H3-Lys79 methylase [Entomortierella chlamydospora]
MQTTLEAAADIPQGTPRIPIREQGRGTREVEVGAGAGVGAGSGTGTETGAGARVEGDAETEAKTEAGAGAGQRPSTPPPPPPPLPAPRTPPRPQKPTAVKRKRVENTQPVETAYTSPFSLSSPSPDRNSHPSSDRELGPDDSTQPLFPFAPDEAGSVEQVRTDNVTDLSTNKSNPQRSLEMELFGIADIHAGLGDADSKTAKSNIMKPEHGLAPNGAVHKPSKASKMEDEDDEYGSLGSLNTERDLISKKSNGRPGNKKKHHSDKLKQRSRLIVTINTKKCTVTISTTPPSLTNGHRPPKPSTIAKTPKDEAQRSETATYNGSEVRRLSILHSEQIVASAIGRYKNHFHMLDEDSDSTVASSPSSTGADTMHVALEYPGKDAREKFTLMKPFLSRSKVESDDKDEYNPIDDLVQTVRIIIDHYFSPELSKELFGTATEGLYRNMTKYKNRKDGAQFLKTVEDFNQIMKTQKSLGVIQGHVRQYGHRMPYDLVVHILQQVYSRTVAARATKLNQYEAFSNNVYGEILPILTKEFIQRTKLDNTKVFVDLGCGIGNVVLQVALQTGAESYGVEIMDTPAKFSKKQAREFEARSRAYGLRHGSVSMMHGDFLDTPGLPGILARADVVLVNNYAFDSALNQSLLQLFLDLKEGCKIISLKTFVSLDHKINVRNAGSVESILRVKKYPYYTNAVSWTHNGGEYFIATVDRSAVQAFWSNYGASLDDGGGRRSSRRR